jgi:hypothetical protein
MDRKNVVSPHNDHQGLVGLEAPGVLLQDIVEGRDRDHAVKNEPATDRLLNDWTALDELVGECVEVTTVSHEKFIESTSHAFCNYDQSGTILSANQRMLDLNPDCIGRSLECYFADIQTDVRHAIAKGSQRPHDLLLRTRRGLAPMLAEFGRIQTDDTSGGYALMLDMSDRIHAERKALEAATFGMLKLDAKHRIVFATEKACELLEKKSRRSRRRRRAPPACGFR